MTQFWRSLALEVHGGWGGFASEVRGEGGEGGGAWPWWLEGVGPGGHGLRIVVGCWIHCFAVHVGFGVFTFTFHGLDID